MVALGFSSIAVSKEDVREQQGTLVVSMVTAEELARAACDDQEWKKIEIRAAAECCATCFRAAINILDGEIAKLPPNALAGAREQIQKRLGRDRLQRLMPFLQHEDIHDDSRLG
jgi:hypothetical protein